ncbi:SEL1-like repeat protein [Vibrio penaeicida]|uniref:SEL1-like repeat protein n=1 Tax=Vibrio penaeicida TaxID=104609 RepID=UPI001CC4ED21|nr:SEL1-like repeat protein [Vibrio penaeicida]
MKALTYRLVQSLVLLAISFTALAVDGATSEITKQMVYRELAKLNEGGANFYILGQAYQYGLYVPKNTKLAIRYYQQMPQHQPSLSSLLHLYSQVETFDNQQALETISILEEMGEEDLVSIRLYHEIISGKSLSNEYIRQAIHGRPRTDAYVHLALAHWFYDQGQIKKAYQYIVTANGLGYHSTLNSSELLAKLWSPKLLGLTVSTTTLTELLDALDRSEDFYRNSTDTTQVIPYLSTSNAIYEGIIIEPSFKKEEVKGIQFIFSGPSASSKAYTSVLSKHGSPKWIVKQNIDYLVWYGSGYQISLTVPLTGIPCSHLENWRQLPRHQRIHANQGRCLSLPGTKSPTQFIQYNFPTNTSINTGDTHVEF